MYIICVKVQRSRREILSILSKKGDCDENAHNKYTIIIYNSISEESAWNNRAIILNMLYNIQGHEEQAVPVSGSLWQHSLFLSGYKIKMRLFTSRNCDRNKLKT